MRVWPFVLCLAAGLAPAAMCAGAPLETGERDATLAYAGRLRNPDGGYRSAAAPGASSLGATVSGLRAMRYLAAAAPGTDETRRFVVGCYRENGSFADAPDPANVPDIRSTAMGLMALVELKADLSPYATAVPRWLRANARSLADMYIAAAALDAAHIKPADSEPWEHAFRETQRPDGSFGSSAMESARGAITLLRLGRKVPRAAGLLESLRRAQEGDGGFGAATDASDLPTTYPVLRAFSMLRSKPDTAAVRRFVRACRNPDGGYGPRPSQPSTLATTYFAAIVFHWLEEMEKAK